MGMLGPPTAVEDGVADLPGSGNSLLCLARSSSSAVDLRATAGLNAESLNVALLRPGSLGGTVIVFVELVAQGADADVQKFGGVGSVSFALFQGGQDVALFKLAQGAKLAGMAAGGRNPFLSEPQVVRFERR